MPVAVPSASPFFSPPMKNFIREGWGLVSVSAFFVAFFFSFVTAFSFFFLLLPSSGVLTVEEEAEGEVAGISGMEVSSLVALTAMIS